MQTWARYLNTLWILVLACVLLGAYSYQFTKREEPCSLCMLQRLMMIAMSIGPMLNLRFGTKVAHFALPILAAAIGGSISLRQISLHICPGFPSFGEPVFGLELYTWAFLVFVCSMLGEALLLLLYRPTFERHKMHPIEKGAMGLMFLIAFANTITTFMECGLSACE